MENTESVSNILSIFSIAVSLIAIGLSLWIWHISRTSSEEASKTLIEVKSTAESVKHDIQDITAQLLHSVLHKGESDSWKNDMCCSNNEVITKERKVRKNIYVSVVTMDYEVSQFIQVIADNLNQGKQYFYFLPEDILGGYEGETQKFVNALVESAGVPEDILKANLIIRKVRSGEILCNVTLFDPGFPPEEGFILPAYDNAERAFSVKLDHTLYTRAWTRVQKWLQEDGSSIIWPSTDSVSKEIKR